MAAPKNRGLGKGLEALFSNSEIDTQEISVTKKEESEEKEETAKAAEPEKETATIEEDTI